MKNTVLTWLAVVVIFTAAIPQASAQSEEVRNVSGFSGVESDDPFNVIVKTDTVERVKIEGSSDNIKLIETIVQNGILRIKYKDDLKNGEGNGIVNIYVSAKSLSSIIKNGAGPIRIIGSLTGNFVKVTLNGSGNIQSSVKCGNLQATIEGAGNINLSGTTSTETVMIIGPGKVNSHDVKTNDASAIINGAGSAYFTAEKSISAEIVGSGQIFYAGNATVVQNKTSGSGGLSKID